MIIVPLSAQELVTMRGIANGELFAWNVRQWLTKKSKVNRDIENSIRTKSEHKYFPAFHNGLTILCKNLKNVNGKITISGYAVVNGCQSLTGLYDNKAELTPSLRILTKLIQIQPESVLARKITDHTNNQNGITYRDLQSNNPLQTRLQSELHSRYKDEFYYRIKRGEHPEWNPDKVIENELAARILLAYDVKEPWSCHQTYKLFDELHSRIFGRPEVNSDRVIALNEIYETSKSKLGLIKNNQLFADYGLTKFLLLYLIREALETDDTGTALTLRPSFFLSQKDGRRRLRNSIANLAQTIVRLLDGEIGRRNDPIPFDFKRELKSPTAIRDLRSTVISQYQIAVDSGLARSFSELWEKSKSAKKS